MNETEILGRVSLFSHLKNRDLKRIAKLSRQCTFPKGEKIITGKKKRVDNGVLSLSKHGQRI